MSEFKSKLVWSDDPKEKQKLEAEAKPSTTEVSDDFVKNGFWTAVFRIEKSGRGGKTVTVVDRLPKQDKFVRELCKELKVKCGAGGTYSLATDHGSIEIQGDKRAEIKMIFEKKGFRFGGM